MVWSPSDSDGEPTSGSMKVTVTFTGSASTSIRCTTCRRASDFQRHARAREGAHPPGVGDVPARAASSSTFSSHQPSYIYSSAPFVNATDLAVGTWKVSHRHRRSRPRRPPAAVFDTTKIVQIGMQFTTGDPFDGGTPTFGQAVFEIDTVQA